ASSVADTPARNARRARGATLPLRVRRAIDRMIAIASVERERQRERLVDRERHADAEIRDRGREVVGTEIRRIGLGGLDLERVSRWESPLVAVELRGPRPRGWVPDERRDPTLAA